MILLTVEEIISLHEKLISRSGGSFGIRDMGLLESAVYSAVANYEGFDAYPSIEEKAARLMFALANNHAFIDGNKRIAVFVMLMTLQLNEVKIDYTQKELIFLGLSVADGKTNYNEILTWITCHKVK